MLVMDPVPHGSLISLRGMLVLKLLPTDPLPLKVPGPLPNPAAETGTQAAKLEQEPEAQIAEYPRILLTSAPARCSCRWCSHLCR